MVSLRLIWGWWTVAPLVVFSRRPPHVVQRLLTLNVRK